MDDVTAQKANSSSHKKKHRRVLVLCVLVYVPFVKNYSLLAKEHWENLRRLVLCLTENQAIRLAAIRLPATGARHRSRRVNVAGAGAHFPRR